MKASHFNYVLNSTIKVILVIVSLLLLFYTGYRAANLSFTIDESISFNVYAQQKFMDILSYKIASANSHMINTFCLRYISLLFGTNEFLLRIPSLLSHLIYIIFTYRIIRKISSPLIILGGFLLLNLNTFMLDYFSLARGYAMAVSFTVVSIYYLFNYIDKNKTNDFIWSLVFAVVAVLCSFCLMIYYVSLIAVINIYWISIDNRFKFKRLFKNNIPVLFSFLFLVLIMFEPIRKLIKYKEFYDGGHISFWTDTVGSLINSSLYEQPYQHILFSYLKYFLGTCILIMIMTILYRFYLLKWKIFSERNTISLLLLLIPCIVSIVQHILLKSLFLINRMALFFIPLFFISFILFLSDYIKIKKLRILLFSFIFFLTAATIVHAFNTLNTSYTLIWRYDADTKQALSDLEKDVKNSHKTSVKLGVMWLFEPTSNFYRTSRKYEWLEKVTENNYKSLDYNYYYLADSSMNFIKENNLSIIKHYRVSNSYLLRKD